MRNLIGQQFDKLLVRNRDMTKPQGSHREVWWQCDCSCGGSISVPTSRLLKGDTRSCGCLAREPKRIIDLTGETFGKLTVLGRDFTKPSGKARPAYWLCQCSCGDTCSVRSDHLRSGYTSSCGCINSKGELKITQLLNEAGWSFKRQYNFRDLVGQGNVRLMFDFGILNPDGTLRCLIEYQGLQHFEPFHFDTQERFDQRVNYDQIKRAYCDAHQIPLVEILYTDYDNLTIKLIADMIEKEERRNELQSDKPNGCC